MATNNRIDELEQQVLTLQRRLMEAEAKSIRAEEQLERVTVEVAVRDAIARSSTPVSPSAVPDVVRRAVQAGGWHQDPQRGLIRLDGGLPDLDAMGRTVTPAVWLENLQSDAPHLFVPAGGNAEAAPKNPWLKDGWNMIQQGEIFKRDPALARKLAADAGIKLGA
jgi:hypothetical protein